MRLVGQPEYAKQARTAALIVSMVLACLQAEAGGCTGPDLELVSRAFPGSAAGLIVKKHLWQAWLGLLGLCHNLAVKPPLQLGRASSALQHDVCRSRLSMLSLQEMKKPEPLRLQALSCGVRMKLAWVQIKAEHVELEELREMKDDVVRRERAQAAIIDNQARRLEELDVLYKVGCHLSCPLSARSSACCCATCLR